MYVYMSCLSDIQWRRAFFLSLFITCLSICKNDKATGVKANEVWKPFQPNEKCPIVFILRY